MKYLIENRHSCPLTHAVLVEDLTSFPILKGFGANEHNKLSVIQDSPFVIVSGSLTGIDSTAT